MIYQTTLQTKVGLLILKSTETHIIQIDWSKTIYTDKKHSPLPTVLQNAIQQLEDYFSGSRKIFNLPLKPQGTPFQQSVWKELMSIPYNKTISYSELAIKINNPKAARAVGSANGKNAISIVIPCHRVIAADGTLGGYAGGIDRKAFLLQHEKST